MPVLFFLYDFYVWRDNSLSVNTWGFLFCVCSFHMHTHLLYLPRIKSWMLKRSAVTKHTFFSLRRSMMPCSWSLPGREFHWWPLLCLQTASPLFSTTCCRSSWAKLWVLNATVHVCRPVSRHWFCTSTTGPMWGRPDFDLITDDLIAQQSCD